MSKKNIARTAIEGGRMGRNKFERRQSLKSNRCEVNSVVRRFTYDPEYADEVAIEPHLPVRKEFADKLAAPQRWLAKKAVGKSLDEVRGLLLSSFDTRSLAGRHLVFDHLMPRFSYGVLRTGIYLSYATFQFDDDGILRNLGKRRSHPKAQKKIRIRARQWFKTIPIELKIGSKDGAYFLCAPSEKSIKVECEHKWCYTRTKEYVPGFGLNPFVHPTAILNGVRKPYHHEQLFVPVRQLTDQEVIFWKALRSYRWSRGYNHL